MAAGICALLAQGLQKILHTATDKCIEIAYQDNLWAIPFQKEKEVMNIKFLILNKSCTTQMTFTVL